MSETKVEIIVSPEAPDRVVNEAFEEAKSQLVKKLDKGRTNIDTIIVRAVQEEDYSWIITTSQISIKGDTIEDGEYQVELTVGTS